MEYVKKENQFSIPGLLLCILATIFLGSVIGIIGNVVSNFFHTVFLFPLLLGIAGCLALAFTLPIVNIQLRAFRLIMAVIIAVAIYGSYWAASYFYDRYQVKVDIEEEYGPQNQRDIDAYIEQVLEENTGHTGLAGYMILMARGGTEFSSYGPNGISLGSVSLNPVMTWIYWLIEFGIILATIMLIIKDHQPQNDLACSRCHKIYSRKKYLGGVANEKEDDFLRTIRDGDLVSAGEMINQSAQDTITIELQLYRCTCCENEEGLLGIYQLKRKPKANIVRELLETRNVTRDEMNTLLDTIEEDGLEVKSKPSVLNNLFSRRFKKAL